MYRVVDIYSEMYIGIQLQDAKQVLNRTSSSRYSLIKGFSITGSKKPIACWDIKYSKYIRCKIFYYDNFSEVFYYSICYYVSYILLSTTSSLLSVQIQNKYLFLRVVKCLSFERQDTRSFLNWHITIFVDSNCFLPHFPQLLSQERLTSVELHNPSLFSIACEYYFIPAQICRNSFESFDL